MGKQPCLTLDATIEKIIVKRPKDSKPTWTWKVKFPERYGFSRSTMTYKADGSKAPTPELGGYCKVNGHYVKFKDEFKDGDLAPITPGGRRLFPSRPIYKLHNDILDAQGRLS